jgi:hypothetical protein
MLSASKANGQTKFVATFLFKPRFRSFSISSGKNGEESAVSPTAKDNSRYRKGRLFVSASEIANLINVNPYVSVGDAVERLWEKNNKKSFATALARHNLQVFTAEERLKDLGLLGLASAAAESEDPKKHAKQLRSAVNAVASEQDKSVVRDFINTSRGIRDEKKTFKTLQELVPSAKFEPDGSLYQRSVEIPGSNVEYFLSGYIDGVERNQNRVIEIKNRQHRFFNHVPLYEQVQCQAYLFLTELEVCEHTESYRGELKTTTLRFEPPFWNHIVQKLNRVILSLDGMLKDIDLQDEFLRSRVLQETQNEGQPGKQGRGKGAKGLKSKSRIYKTEITKES